MLGRQGLQIAAQSLHCCRQAPCRLGQARTQPFEDGGALIGIAPGLGEIAADDVAALADFDLLGLELGELARGARHGQRHEWRLIIDHRAAHLGAAALAHAKDVFELALFERGHGRGADHAAVGDDAQPADAKTVAQPIDDRHQGRYIGGVAGPHRSTAVGRPDP